MVIEFRKFTDFTRGIMYEILKDARYGLSKEKDEYDRLEFMRRTLWR